MTPEFLEFFLDWASKNKFYLTTGSDFNKVQDQLPEEVLKLSAGVFCCMGNQLFTDGGSRMVYQNNYEPSEDLLRTLNSYLDRSDYPHPWRVEPHIEHRVGMVNFSIAGRGSDMEMREIYNRFDNNCRERERIREVLINMYPEIDVSIGGKISLDIYPKGNDKSQSVRYIMEKDRPSYIIFLGDRARPGGNDHSVCEALDKMGRGVWFNVANCRETRAILKISNLYINRDGD